MALNDKNGKYEVTQSAIGDERFGLGFATHPSSFTGAVNYRVPGLGQNQGGYYTSAPQYNKGAILSGRQLNKLPENQKPKDA